MNGYVLYWCEHMRDGIEDGARCFADLRSALAFINAERFAKDNYTFHLFELGREIELERTVEKVETVSVSEKPVYRVKGG